MEAENLSTIRSTQTSESQKSHANGILDAIEEVRNLKELIREESSQDEEG
jgi:hypothetical protein